MQRNHTQGDKEYHGCTAGESQHHRNITPAFHAATHAVYPEKSSHGSDGDQASHKGPLEVATAFVSCIGAQDLSQVIADDLLSIEEAKCK